MTITSSDAIPIPAKRSLKSLGLFIAKWGLFVAVLYFVIRYGVDQWKTLDLRNVQWSPGWLAAAMIVYFFSWIPAAWVWGELLRSAGSKLGFYPLVRAHFCGHVGKYIPGKALSLVIRAALVREHEVPLSMAGLMATVETLITMATGVIVTVVLLPLLIGQADTQGIATALPVLAPVLDAPSWQRWTAAGLILAFAIATIPIFTRLLALATKKLSRKIDSASTAELHLPYRTVGKWMLVLAGGWFLNGCSLGLVLMSLGISPDLANSPLLWTCAVAGATSLGFLVLFAPGGLGVREAILIGVLQLSPQIDASFAVVAAVLLRLISFLSEVLFTLLLYSVSGKRVWKPESQSDD
ncbi:lysylphosphatidylglycerol synthase transmembrane domain-containing protein [Rubinisphaera italica]|uniref:Uncharacterized protein n=1 Tax=Rubinisphaera italica TaxID=2527969 RepID=A0A5C5XP38_9PLAN|nr:lysylphosphatidylglycerol synthase transmembrane domain-containing protein [Rubinisphaera italica]TWT63815.1 hypothetical protein Pan54_45740 [Rubinisphaera italica]